MTSNLKHIKARRKPEAWAVIDTDGSFLGGPSNSRNEAEKEAERRWPVMAGPAWKATCFVPADAELKSLRRLAKTSAGLATEWRLMGVVSESSMRLLSMAVEAHRKRMAKSAAVDALEAK